MRKIKYPLIVSDFDGTLVKEDGTISRRTKATIHQYISDGGRFAISTGRMPSGILPRARELGLKGVVCCGQGSAIIDIESNEVILQGRIPLTTALKVCEKMEAMGLHIHVYDLWEYYSNLDDEALAQYERVVGNKGIVVGSPITEFVAEKGLEPFKILAMVKPEDNERICRELTKENFEGCVVTRSSKYLVEVCNAAYSKGTAVEFLAKYYHVPIEKTIAVGDQFNDLPMIEKAGLGIAVKNADYSLKQKAILFGYTNEEDAIAEVIQEYGYEEEEK